MSTFRLDNAGIDRFFTAANGPVVRDLRRRGENVQALARAYASGPILGIKTHRLLDFLGPPNVVLGPPEELRVEIGTTANKAGFSYPAFHDIAGTGTEHGGKRPWLTTALRDGFDA